MEVARASRRAPTHAHIETRTLMDESRSFMVDARSVRQPAERRGARARPLCRRRTFVVRLNVTAGFHSATNLHSSR